MTQTNEDRGEQAAVATLEIVAEALGVSLADCPADKGTGTWLAGVIRDFRNAAPVAAQAQPPKLTRDEMEALHDFQRTVIMDSCHTLGKPMITRLTGVGALESMGFGKHRLTEYGKWLLERHTTSVIDTASVAPGPS